MVDIWFTFTKWRSGVTCKVVTYGDVYFYDNDFVQLGEGRFSWNSFGEHKPHSVSYESDKFKRKVMKVTPYPQMEMLRGFNS